MRWSPAFPSRCRGRWVLLVRSGGARLFRGSRRVHGPVADFPADDTGYAGLRRYLERAARSPIHLLVDLTEEDFQRETVPHVHGRTRRSVLATRSARLFPGMSHVSARREGRTAQGRRDDRILFSAILRPERIEPWLDALRGSEVAGVHSLPIVSAGLLPLLGSGAGRVLLVTENGERHLRQTFFEDGRLVLSRLAALPPGEPADRAGPIVAEMERLLHHLGRAGHSTKGLSLRLLGSASLLAAVRKSKIPRELAEGLVDAVTVEGRLGRRSRPRTAERGDASNSGCDRIFARLVVSRRPPNHYAPPSVLATYRTKQAARALNATGIALFLAGAAWSGSAWYRSGDLAAATEALAREATGVEARLRAERLPKSEVGTGDLRLAVETAQRLGTNRVGAVPILRTVGEALARFPALQLESLEWFEITEREGWSGPPGENPARERFRIVHLRGRVEPFTGHHREAVDEVFRFMDGLEAMPRLTGVDLTDLPQNHGGRGRGLGPETGFEVRMVLDVRDG